MVKPKGVRKPRQQSTPVHPRSGGTKKQPDTVYDSGRVKFGPGELNLAEFDPANPTQSPVKVPVMDAFGKVSASAPLNMSRQAGWDADIEAGRNDLFDKMTAKGNLLAYVPDPGGNTAQDKIAAVSMFGDGSTLGWPPRRPGRRRAATSHDPQAALFAQLRLMRWYPSVNGLDYLEIWKAAYPNTALGLAPAESLARFEVANLDKAETYYVTSDMSRVVEAAARTAPCDSLRLSDLPSPSGFVYFEHPLEAHDDIAGEGAGSRDVQVRAICWHTSDVRGRDDEYVAGLAFTVYVDRDTWLFEEDRPSIPGLSKESLTPLLLFDMSGWTFNAAWFEGPNPEADADGLRELTPELRDAGACIPSISFFRRTILAFFRLTFQRIAVIRKERLSRQALRSAQRGGRTAPDMGTISVVRLRRESQQAVTAASKGSVEWSHRWINSGHWRNQPYPSLGIHKEIYIEPYPKGPPGKPLIIKHRIQSLER